MLGPTDIDFGVFWEGNIHLTAIIICIFVYRKVHICGLHKLHIDNISVVHVQGGGGAFVQGANVLCSCPKREERNVTRVISGDPSYPSGKSHWQI